MHAALLMLVDGRFPAGGHAHSAGIEAAVHVGDVVDAATLERYLRGRLATTGRVDAAFAANACAQLGGGRVDTVVERALVLDAEYSARTPSPYLRSVSRRMGRQFLRPASGIWSSAGIDSLGSIDGGPHQPIALGAVVAAAGGTPAHGAALACHHLVAAVTSAGIRLLGLDALALAGIQARVGRQADALVDRATAWAAADPSELPADGGMLTEILGQRHGALDARMFVA